MNMLKYMKAKQEESTFDTGDKVRYIINLSSFEKNLFQNGVKVYIQLYLKINIPMF